jgi:hypothetical protein
MSSELIVYVTIDGQKNEIDHVLGLISDDGKTINTGKLEKVWEKKLPFIVSDSLNVSIRYFSEKKTIAPEDTCRALLFRGRWNSNQLTDAVLHRLSAAFPRVIWRLYLDSYETYASCDVYSAGFKTHALTVSGTDYYRFFKNGDDSEIDSDGVYNFLDSLYAKDEGKTPWFGCSEPIKSVAASQKTPENLDDVLSEAWSIETLIVILVSTMEKGHESAEAKAPCAELMSMYESEIGLRHMSDSYAKKILGS